MDIPQFFKNNIRYIVIIILLLFFIKSFQSCNRNIKVKKLEKEIVFLNDSLSSIHGSEKNQLIFENLMLKDSIKDLNYEVKLANSEKNSAIERAIAVQKTAEGVRKNTTIKIEHKSDKDTVSINN